MNHPQVERIETDQQQNCKLGCGLREKNGDETSLHLLQIALPVSCVCQHEKHLSQMTHTCHHHPWNALLKRLKELRMNESYDDEWMAGDDGAS